MWREREALPMEISKRDRLHAASAVLEELRRQARKAGITEADIERAIAEYRARTPSARR